MKSSKRKFISIYFEDGLLNKRSKRDLTVSFNQKDPLYNKCKKLGSAKIKELIGVKSYKELIRMAEKDDRSLSNYIKYKLKENLINE